MSQVLRHSIPIKTLCVDTFFLLIQGCPILWKKNNQNLTLWQKVVHV